MKPPQKSQPYQTVTHVFLVEQRGVCTRAVSACSAESPRQGCLYAQTAVVCAMPQQTLEIFDGGATALYPDSYGCFFVFMF
jgi:hypothetical protein